MAQTAISRSALCSYTLTNTDLTMIEFRNDYYLSSDPGSMSVVDKQFSLIALAQALFKNSQPVNDNEMQILNEAFTEVFSKSPTRL